MNKLTPPFGKTEGSERERERIEEEEITRSFLRKPKIYARGARHPVVYVYIYIYSVYRAAICCTKINDATLIKDVYTANNT